MHKIDIDDLVGKPAKLYYCNELHSFQLGSIIFEVIEDERDGYRSSMSHVDIIKEDAPLREFLDNVEITQEDNGNIYNIVGSGGHVWVSFGTQNWDDYYPCFHFATYPKSVEYYTKRINL